MHWVALGFNPLSAAVLASVAANHSSRSSAVSSSSRNLPTEPATSVNLPSVTSSHNTLPSLVTRNRSAKALRATSVTGCGHNQRQKALYVEMIYLEAAIHVYPLYPQGNWHWSTNQSWATEHHSGSRSILASHWVRYPDFRQLKGRVVYLSTSLNRPHTIKKSGKQIVASIPFECVRYGHRMSATRET